MRAHQVEIGKVYWYQDSAYSFCYALALARKGARVDLVLFQWGKAKSLNAVVAGPLKRLATKDEIARLVQEYPEHRQELEQARKLAPKVAGLHNEQDGKPPLEEAGRLAPPSSLDAALTFIETVGGLAEAKAQLAMLERIAKLAR